MLRWLPFLALLSSLGLYICVYDPSLYTFKPNFSKKFPSNYRDILDTGKNAAKELKIAMG
jgi:hypothetical protein